MIKTMKMNEKRVYVRPESKTISIMMESSLLVLSAEGRENDPVGGSDAGDTGDWGWN